MKAILQRVIDTGECTRGALVVQGVKGMVLHTLEEPWKDNRRGISCIPPGIYECVPHGWNGEPVHMKQCWEIVNVPNRHGVLFHQGNTTDEIEGCCLVGLYAGIYKDKDAVLRSVDAMEVMRNLIGNNKFTVDIRAPGDILTVS